MKTLLPMSLEQTAARYPLRNAVVTKTTELTYLELNTLSSQVCQALLNYGVGRNSRIAYLMDNKAEVLILWHAIQKAGAVAVPLNKRLRAKEIGGMLQMVSASAFFFDVDALAVASEALDKLDHECLSVAVGKDDLYAKLGWEEFLARGLEGEHKPVAENADDEALILFSSGTTGMPKAAVRTVECISLLSMAMQDEDYLAQINCDVLYTQAPLYHLGGVLAMLRTGAVGGTLVLESRFDMSLIFDLIEEHEVTQLYMIPPTLFSRMFSAPERQGRVFPKVCFAHGAGGRTTLENIQAVSALFPNAKLKLSFGGTEMGALTYASFTCQELDSNPKLMTSIGKPNPQVDIKLVNKDGDEAASCEPGEALVKSPLLFKEYVNNPELTRSVFSAEGYYHTGDILKVDEEGYYYFVDRRSDIIKTGGENVYAHEVEEAVLAYPGIAECAAVGIPDSCLSEAVAIAVVLEKKNDFLDEGDLLGFCRSRLPSFNKPQYLAIMDALPRNSLGKIQKKELLLDVSIFQPIARHSNSSSLEK